MSATLAHAPAPAHGFTRSLPALLLLGLSAAIAFTMIGSFATVQEAAKAELGLSDYRLGLVQGVSAAVPLVLLSIPIGVAVDRTVRVRLLVALGLTWTVGTLLTALAGSFATLFVARMLTAVGMSGALTCALSLAADLCAPEHRGKATLIVTLGKSAGLAGGFAVAGSLFGLFDGAAAPRWFGDVAPWRSTHFALAILSAALILPLLLLREPPRREVEAGPGAPFREVVRELWDRRRFLIPLFAGQLSIVMADNAANVWAAPVLSRNYGLGPGDFAGWMGLLLFGTGVAGAIVGGFAADAGHRSRRKGGLLIGAIVAAAISIPAALFPIIPDVTGFAFALGVLTLSGTVTSLIVSVALTVMLPNELRGLCIGGFIAIAGLIGYGIAPPLVALISEMIGGERHLGTALASMGVVTSTLGLIGFSIAMRRAPVR